MKLVKSAGSKFVDFPIVANALIFLLVVTQAIASERFPFLNVPARLSQAAVDSGTLSELTDLSLGAASIAAMVGGFAGVVVIFGLGAEYDRFRVLRQAGGRRLRASWVSVVLVSFTAAFGSVVAAIVVVAFDPTLGMWIFETALLLSAHGAIRLTWLLSRLARLVDAADADVTKESDKATVEEMFPGNSRE